MTTEATSVFQALSNWVLAADPTSADWGAASHCAGWSNLDILIHLGCTLRELVEPDSLPAPIPGSIEQTNDVQVAAFRSEDARFHLAEYARLRDPAIEVIWEFQSADRRSETFSLDDAGTYPVHLIAEALVFDHFCHLGIDLTLGDSIPAIPVGLAAPALASSTQWLVAGLPQMSGRALAEALTSPVGLRITGPGGGSWILAAADSSAPLADCGFSEALPPTTIETGAADFILWGTGRRRRLEFPIRLSGDVELADSAAAAIHVY